MTDKLYKFNNKVAELVKTTIGLVLKKNTEF